MLVQVDGSYNVVCDVCGRGQRKEYDTMKDSVASCLLKDGWEHRKNKGLWEYVCKDCQGEAGGSRMNLMDYVKECHYNAQVKGFYDEPLPFPSQIMLIVTELAEAVEADRAGDWYALREELADVAIRLFDLCGYLSIDLEAEVRRKMEINAGRARKHGKEY